jgi:hypothetical protein
MVKKILGFLFVVLLAAPGAVLAQDKPPAQAAPPANPITQSMKGFYVFVSGAVVRAAEKMP